MSSNAKKALVAVAAVAVVGLVLCAQNLRWPEAIAGDKDAKPSPPTNAEAKVIADEAMAQWKLKNPDRVEQWVKEEKERHKIQPPADNTALLKGEQGKGHTYGNYTERDLLIWSRETEKLVVDGSRIFHSSELLGGTVGVSCDMCHPDAANTHPETYPKFQAQMGRGALLRDMINWCIEHPVRGKALAADDARMRALEAYILAQRKGVKLDYGKH